MTTELVIAFLAGAVSLASIWISTRAQQRLAGFQAELEERRTRAAKDDEAERMLARFREPLSSAAFDLQSRIYNLICLDILDRFFVQGSPREREYVVESTLYVFGQYLGWCEIIRREVQFLDLRDVDRTRRLADLQLEISELLLQSRLPPPFRVFRTEQRAIGELMIDPQASAPQCLGPAGFTQHKEESFRRWFEPLEVDVRALAATDDRYVERLVRVQHALIDLIRFLDAERSRFPDGACRKIALRARSTHASDGQGPRRAGAASTGALEP